MRTSLRIAALLCVLLLPRVSDAQDRLSHSISMEILDELLTAEAAPLPIDLRSAQDFARAHIPNSLNIPAFAIKTKAFLRAKPLLLIDEGFRPAALDALCRQLNEAGFDARYLYGGLNAWRSAGRRLHGDPFAIRELSHIPPKVLLSGTLDASRLIIDSSATPSGLFSQAVFCPFQENRASDFQACVKAAASQTAGSARALLLLNERGRDYERIDSLLQDSGIPLRWYLQGGARAYRKERALQQHIAEGRESSAACTRPADCRPCAR